MSQLPQEIADIILDLLRDYPVFYQLDRGRSLIQRFIVFVDCVGELCRIQIKRFRYLSCYLYWSTYPLRCYVRIDKMRQILSDLRNGKHSEEWEDWPYGIEYWDGVFHLSENIMIGPGENRWFSSTCPERVITIISDAINTRQSIRRIVRR